VLCKAELSQFNLPLCRNMDVVGVPEVTAEAELLAAIVMFLERVGLTAEDVVIKVSSRKVLQAILERYDVPEESFGAVCVVVDKLDKMSKEKVIDTTSIGFKEKSKLIGRKGQFLISLRRTQSLNQRSCRPRKRAWTQRLARDPQTLIRY